MNAQYNMFSTQEQRDAEKIGKLLEMPINDLIPFQGHTFQVRHDAEMESLIDSIKENGVMEPIIAFKNEDGLVEQVTGHRRVYACQELDIPTIPTLIKVMTRDEATILMGASNLERRTEILPSEKAATYKAMLDALKRQGKRSDIISDSSDIRKGRADDELSKIVKESRNMIQRYIRLNYLNPELLQLVDEKRIALKPAVELSYLSGSMDVAIDSSKTDFQKIIYDYYVEFDVTPSHAQALKMHKLFKENILAPEDVSTILSNKKGNQKTRTFKISENIVLKYFKGCESDVDIEKRIIKAMDLLEKQEGIINKGSNTSNQIESGVE